MRVVNDLKQHMLTVNQYKRYISIIIKQDISYQKINTVQDHYLVKEDDSLFWAFYIVTFGMDKYIMNKGKNYNIQQDIKISSIESIKHNKDILKNHGIKKTELEENLLYGKEITYCSFLYLCMLFKQNIVIIDNRVYYECIGNTSDDKITMFKKSNHHYAIYNKLEKDYSIHYYKINKISKPILAISSYKLNELQDICKKLKLELDGKKKDLYERIVKCIN